MSSEADLTPDRGTTMEKGAMGARLPPALPGHKARTIAELAHRGQVEPSGRPYLHHVRRVAAAVPPEAASIAWLHDVLEWTDLDEEDLVAAGLAPEGSAALALLTRPDEPDDESFLAHVRAIALATGPAGDAARLVKRADMEDRLRLPRDPWGAWMPPYRRALELLAALAPADPPTPAGPHRFAGEPIRPRRHGARARSLSHHSKGVSP
jgi:hypothetical protein